ncbi:hypothetical protein [Actinoplanes ianthinogenes]|nr:hypothetical protein [Actinoplanes ianthinogenes]
MPSPHDGLLTAILDRLDDPELALTAVLGLGMPAGWAARIHTGVGC